jgi:hydrogenase-4 component F
MKLAFVFIVVGYGTKAGLAPCTPGFRTHSQAPSPVSGLLSGVLLKCALISVFASSITDLAVGGLFRDGLLIRSGL